MKDFIFFTNHEEGIRQVLKKLFRLKKKSKHKNLFQTAFLEVPMENDGLCGFGVSLFL